MEQKKSMELDLWSFNKIQKIICFLLFHFWGLKVVVFYATFINISVILWGAVLLVEQTKIPRGNQRPVESRKLYHVMLSST